jgi:hypothetical protein
MRDLTNVEINVIKAIHEEVGTKALIELLISWATMENGTPAAKAQVETISAEVAERDRVAKLDDQARGVKAQVERVKPEGIKPEPNPVARLAVGVGRRITEGESRMLVKIAESEYMDDDPTGQTWSNCVCDNLSDAALVGTLNKKGLVISRGRGREAIVELTQDGLRLYRELRPESQYAKDHAQMEVEQAQAERSHVNL